MSEFDDLFFPKSVAIVGAKKGLNFGSAFFIHALKLLEYQGEIYYINPYHVGETIYGREIISSLDEIDHPVDLVYSCIKAKYVPDLVRQCVKRKDKFLVVFTSGFSELLTEDAIKLEKEILSIVKGSSTRLIGPNCLGPYCPKGRIGWDTGSPPPNVFGNVAFASQSGGHASNLLRVASGRGFYYSKGLSFGNQIDINCLEILDYYGNDPDTEVIAMYLESTGSANGNEFFRKLKEVAAKKPVIIWKGGQTEEGNKAAASHTGAISGSLIIWKSMVKQAGAIYVEDSEEFWDMIHLLSILVPNKHSKPIARLGIACPGGGNSVELTDIFTRNGLKVPTLTEETQEKLSSLLPSVNTSVKNPVDLGAVGLMDRVFINTIKFLADDPNIDAIINFQPIDWLTNMEENVGTGYIRATARTLGRIRKQLKKPLIELSPNFRMTENVGKVALDFLEICRKRGIPLFPSAKRLSTSLIKYNEYIAHRTAQQDI
ncbi:MAG: CoA-binding protein [Candidatus Helarchaeota archaeon]